MEVIDYKSKGFKAVIVALNNCQVHIYKEKYLVNVIKTDAVVTGLKFGQFGREEGTLIMTLKGKSPLLKAEIFLCNALRKQIMWIIFYLNGMQEPCSFEYLFSQTCPSICQG